MLIFLHSFCSKYRKFAIFFLKYWRFENRFTIPDVFVYDSVGEKKEKGVKIVWFGVSERGLKLTTTLHGDLLLMVDKSVCMYMNTVQLATGLTFVSIFQKSQFFQCNKLEKIGIVSHSLFRKLKHMHSICSIQTNIVSL